MQKCLLLMQIGDERFFFGSRDREYEHKQKDLDKERTSALPDRVGVTNLDLIIPERAHASSYHHVTDKSILVINFVGPTRDWASKLKISRCHATPTFVHQLTRS